MCPLLTWSRSTPRSLLFFVIRDHLGTTPLGNLRTTLIQDLTKIWSSISKPQGLEGSRIEDYFDFGFAALPHKILQADRFTEEVQKLGSRFTAGHRHGKPGLHGDQELEGGLFLAEYHRRIPADGFSVYAEGIWDQIVNNKDLDLPTQQELLAQFRCDEISREVLIDFDLIVSPLEDKQAEALNLGVATVLPDLGASGSQARHKCIKAFEVQASRYHKGVYSRKRQELEGKIDARLKALYQGQLAAAHKAGVAAFGEAVANKVKAGQKAGGAYEFAEIVANEKRKTLDIFGVETQSLFIEGVAWTNFESQLTLFEKELDEESAKLRKEEMRRLATRVERWVKSRLNDAVGLEFNKLGSGRGGSGAPETGEKPATEKDLWDRVWTVFAGIVKEAEGRFAERAKSFDATNEEVEIGTWRLRRKSWTALREKIEDEVMEGNILLKLRENFEDKFRYDEAGVPRIWRPTDDIEGIYTKARESTLTLVPLLSKFRLSETNSLPDLPGFVGPQPSGVEASDEEDLAPIGGIDEEDGKSLEEEMTVLSEGKRQDLVVRFKKTADGVYVEAKRGAIGGVAQIPWYFYGLLLALGWNEIFMGTCLPSSVNLTSTDHSFLQFCATHSSAFSSSSSPEEPTSLIRSTSLARWSRWATRQRPRASRSPSSSSATSSPTRTRRARRLACRPATTRTTSAWTRWIAGGEGSTALLSGMTWMIFDVIQKRSIFFSSSLLFSCLVV